MRLFAGQRPMLLHYYITNRCNARCPFCDIWQQQPKVDAHPDDVVRNLRDARALGCSFVDFTGGEPLLHEHLDLFLKEARRLGFITSVTTNTLLFSRQAPRLRGLIDLLHFSLDGDTPQSHNALRGVDSFNSVLAACRIAPAFDLYPDLLFTYTDDNIDSLPGVIAIARSRRLICIVDPLFSTTGNEEVSPATHRKAARLSRQPGVYLNRAHLLLRSRGGNDPAQPLCRAASSTIVVLPDNRCALPCFHNVHTMLPLEGGLKKVLHSPAYRQAARLEGRHPFCANCHINCYFDPTYHYHPLSRYHLLSILAKTKYAWFKYAVYRQPWKKGKKNFDKCA